MQGRTPRLRGRRSVWIVGVLAIAIVAATVTQAFATGTSNTIYACVSNQTGDVQIVAANATCSHNQYATSWNMTGLQGPQGDTGPQGPAGPAAPNPAPRQHVVGTMTLTPPASGIAGASNDTTPITFKIYDFSSSQDAATSTTTGGAGAGKTTFSPITVTKLPDAATPELLHVLDIGAHFASAKVQLYAPDGTTVEETFGYRLVALKSIVTTNSGAASDQLFEQLTMEVGAITDIVGKASSTWNIATNSAS